MRFPPGQLPPAQQFWSITMYQLPGRTLVANPIDRYLVNSPMLPQFVKDADGGDDFPRPARVAGQGQGSQLAAGAGGAVLHGAAAVSAKPEALDFSWKRPPMVKVRRHERARPRRRTAAHGAGVVRGRGAGADLLSERQTVVQFPADASHRVYLSDPSIGHLVDGRLHVVDAPRMRYLSMLGTGYIAQTALSRDRSEIYIATTYYSRLQRGT